MAAGSSDAQYLPEQELKDVDGHVRADLDLADEVLPHHPAREGVVGEPVEPVHRRARQGGGSGHARSSSTTIVADDGRLGTAETDSGASVKHLDVQSGAAFQVGRHLERQDRRRSVGPQRDWRRSTGRSRHRIPRGRRRPLPVGPLRHDAHSDLGCEQVAGEADASRERARGDALARDGDIDPEFLGCPGWLGVDDDHRDDQLLRRQPAVEELLGSAGAKHREASRNDEVQVTRHHPWRLPRRAACSASLRRPCRPSRAGAGRLSRPREGR